ncbi:hypothetical protein [Oryza sativa Japonica Group]|uniref:Uncharacterized protein n=1 Tax=Oryza sativa subsp. japonica TaxID=39947 RepID=Q656X6_ORYSJ|nr:hypothetical protein [Oryza sativa Japonica Group]
MVGNRGSKATGRDDATNKSARCTRGGDAAGAAGDGHAVHGGGTSAVVAKYSTPPPLQLDSVPPCRIWLE